MLDKRILCQLNPADCLKADDNVRLYEVQWVEAVQFTDHNSVRQLAREAPANARNIRHISYVMSEGHGYIGAFQSWEEVRDFVLSRMRAEVFQVEGYIQFSSCTRCGAEVPGGMHYCP